jgi:hypothetical protein
LRGVRISGGRLAERVESSAFGGSFALAERKPRLAVSSVPRI